MDKSLGTLLHFWGIFQFTQVQPVPSPHKQCWTRVSRNCSEFQLCIGRGEGLNCRKISKKMHCFKREQRNDKSMNRGGGSSGLLDKGGCGLPKNIFLAFRASVWSEVWSPGSATVSQGLLSRIIDVKNNQYTY